MKMYLAALMLHASLSFVSGGSLLRKVKANEAANEKHARRAQVFSGELPTDPRQKFFVPLKEYDLGMEGFQKVYNQSSDTIESFFAVAVPVRGTIIWYDHFEDGYDNDDVTAPINHVGSPGGSTEVWGDENAANGCAPNQDPCTDATDILEAGTAIVVDDSIVTTLPLPTTPPYQHNGGDMLYASVPVSMTRGAYPVSPGSNLAGAVEVLDTTFWKTDYIIPLDQNSPTDTDAFEIAGYFIMAEEDGTEVILPNSTTITLDQGETHVISDNYEIGDTITSTEPIQVHIITGDKQSEHEMRWFSLKPSDDWSDEYLSPVGDVLGNVRVVVYNPNSEEITVEYAFKNSTNDTEYLELDVGAGSNGRTDEIPDGAAVFLSEKDEKNFVAFVLMDNRDGEQNKGQWYDWGFPAAAVKDLTPTVLVGWGYGCKGNICTQDTNNEPRSLVWVTPVDDATIYCDTDGDGNSDMEMSVERLQFALFEDKNDTDLSGAFIWARDTNDDPVNIAATWGQVPSRTIDLGTDSRALNLGTIIPPLASVSVGKTCEVTQHNPDDIGECLTQDDKATVGDTITYTIFLQASGGSDIEEEKLNITDVLDDNVMYVANSTKYIIGTVETPIDDNDDTIMGVTAFPLDEDSDNPYGFTYPEIIARRDTHAIRFEVFVMEEPEEDDDVLTNTGIVTLSIPFNEVPVEFENECKWAVCDSESTICDQQ